jgi:hypothetical protein
MENILTYIQLASDLTAMAAAVASLADAAMRHKKNPSNESRPGQPLPRPGGTASDSTATTTRPDDE